jgi:hypothetical protein
MAAKENAPSGLNRAPPQPSALAPPSKLPMRDG